MHLPKYLYNMNLKDSFKPGVDTVCYAGPYWGQREINAAIKSLTHGKWLTAGEEVHKFEREFSAYLGQGYSTMVNSGSSANLVMLAALKKRFDWRDGDEIIVSVSGFPTTVAPILQNGLVPRFIDVEMDTLNFDLDAIGKAIRHNTQAIFISPVLGNPPDMDRLVSISDKTGVALILDCCDSLGSRWRSNHLAKYAIASSFSFYPAHHICTGEGGMVTTDDKELSKIATSLVNWGRGCYCAGSNNLLSNGTCKNRFSTWLPGSNEVVDHRYVYTEIGYNMKPLDLQGAIGRVQLEKLDDMNSDRFYNKLVLHNSITSSIPGTKVPHSIQYDPIAWFAVPIITQTSELKQRLVSHFEAHKIQTRPYFAGNILRHPAFKSLDDASNYPNADKVLKTVFFLGCSPTLSNEMLEYVKEVIEEFK